MEAIEGGSISIASKIHLHPIYELAYQIRQNSHGTCRIQAGITKEEAEKLEQTDLFRQKMAVLAQKPDAQAPGCLYQGLVESYRLRHQNGLHTVTITLRTASILLEEQASSRTFQNPEQTGKEIAGQILRNYEEGAVLCAAHIKEPVKTPLIQYRETDWDFLKRLAARYQAPLYPDYKTGRPNLFLGMRTGHLIPNQIPCQNTGISRHYYSQKKQAQSKHQPLARSQFLYYTFLTEADHEIGDSMGQETGAAVIFEKECRLINGTLTFRYRAGGAGNWYQTKTSPEALTGLELDGTVTDTKEEKIKLRFAIDQEKEAPSWQWKWSPTEGTHLYTMPERDTTARLRFCSPSEEDGAGKQAVRQEAPQREVKDRTYQTAAGKSMNLQDRRLSLKGQAGEVAIKDGEALTLSSAGAVTMTAGTDIKLEAAAITIESPQEVKLYYSPLRSQERAGSICPVGSKSNPPTGGEAGIELNNEISSESKYAIMEGRERYEFAPYQDEPEGGVDWYGIGQDAAKGMTIVLVIAGGILYVASVAATGGASLGFAPQVISGLAFTAGTLGVAGQTSKDSRQGYSSGETAYLNAGLIGSLKGAALGGSIYLAPYSAEMILNSVLAPGMSGISMGKVFISADSLLKVIAVTEGGVTAANAAFLLNDSVSEITGINVVKNLIGEENYGALNNFLTAATTTIITSGLVNPNLGKQKPRMPQPKVRDPGLKTSGKKEGTQLSTSGKTEGTQLSAGEKSKEASNIRERRKNPAPRINGATFNKEGSGAPGTGKETELFLPDEFYEKNLPSQVPPGTKYLPKYDELGNVKQIKMYDDFGREIGWVDYTNHGYGNINSPDYHTVPHWHERIYDAQNRDGMKINHRTDTNTPLGDK